MSRAHAALRIAIGARPAYPFWDVTAEDLAEGLSRWALRIHDLDPEKDLATIERLGGGFLTPEDEHWPTGLNDLPDAPWGLWYRGDLSTGIPAPSRCAALTGSRDSTSYGAAVTGDIAYGLAQRGICVISGLAYGIDAHAHRAALAGTHGNGPATIAVLAGGLDRDYPSGNADLAAAIRANGLTLSELPQPPRPGTGSCKGTASSPPSPESRAWWKPAGAPVRSTPRTTPKPSPGTWPPSRAASTALTRPDATDS